MIYLEKSGNPVRKNAAPLPWGQFF
jgi:hypothetical protein